MPEPILCEYCAAPYREGERCPAPIAQFGKGYGMCSPADPDKAVLWMVTVTVCKDELEVVAPGLDRDFVIRTLRQALEAMEDV